MVLFRADANEHIGTGHVMRCLSIAKAFAEHGENVKFITADHAVDRLIQQAGFDSFCLDSDWSLLENELPLLKSQIEKHNPSLLMVDSYYVLSLVQILILTISLSILRVVLIILASSLKLSIKYIHIASKTQNWVTTT